MKKAKIIIAMLAIASVLGGVVAFKAQRYNDFPLFSLATTTITFIENNVSYTAVDPHCDVIPGEFYTSFGLVEGVTTAYTTCTKTITTATRIGGSETSTFTILVPGAATLRTVGYVTAM